MTGATMPISEFTDATLKWTPRVFRDARTNAENVEALSEVRVDAKRASFQLNAKISTAVTIRPSSDSGSDTFQNTCHGVAPSTLAASSILVGTSRKMSRMITTAKARLKVE